MTRNAPLRSSLGGRRRALPVALLCALLAAHAARASDLEQVKLRQKVVVAVFPTQDNAGVSVNLDVLRQHHLKVEELRRPEQFRGCQVELLKGFASSLGVSLEFLPVTTGPAGLFVALTEGKADLIGGNIGITPKRRESADFSRPLLSSPVAVVTKPGNRIATPADLAGKTAAVIDRSPAYELVQAAVPQAKLKLAKFQAEIYADIEEGTADFTLVASALAPGAEYRDGPTSLRVALHLQDVSAASAFAARKGSDLVAPLDAYLDRLRQSGELDRVLELCGGLRPSAPAAPQAPPKP